LAERELDQAALDFSSFERSRDLKLVTALVVNANTGKSLMVGWQNAEAVDCTSDLGVMVFYTRSRNKLWVKGEASGNQLVVVRQSVNCENNTIKYYVEPKGPTCHLGTESCFDLPNVK